MPKGIDRMRRRVRVAALKGHSSGLNGSPSTAVVAPTVASDAASVGSLAQTSSTEGLLEEPYSREELLEYRQLFDMFDTDGSGAIGNSELKEAILSFGHSASDEEIDNLIREVDEDGNGEIDFGEFCHCMRRSQKMKMASNEEFIRQCFVVFDQDGNGIITKNEFIYIAKAVGGFTNELAELVFDELDASSNGFLNADQFAAIVDDYMVGDQSRLYDFDNKV